MGSGKMFPGASMVMGPYGDVRVRGPVWEEGIVTARIDLADLTRARSDVPLLADLRTALPHLTTWLSNHARAINRLKSGPPDES
jgi:predicted amidohydrolase